MNDHPENLFKYTKHHNASHSQTHTKPRLNVRRSPTDCKMRMITVQNSETHDLLLLLCRLRHETRCELNKLLERVRRLFSSHWKICSSLERNISNYDK